MVHITFDSIRRSQIYTKGYKTIAVLIAVLTGVTLSATNVYAEALSYSNLTTGYNPVWHMGLDDNPNVTTVVNVGSNTNQGAATDVTFGTPGVIGTSATFNGNTSKITLTDNNVWNTNQATIEGWVKASDVNLINILGYRNNAGGGHCRQFYTLSNGNLVFYDYVGAESNVSTSQSLITDEWVYLAATVARTGTSGSNYTYTSKLYINGELVATGTKTQKNGVLWNDGNYWIIGNKDTITATADGKKALHTLNGSLDELTTYNAALSQSVFLSKYAVATNQVSEKSLMANATLTASATYTDANNYFGVEKIKDGIIYDISGTATNVQDAYKGYWIAPNGVTNAYITVDLGDTYNIDKIDLQNTRNAGHGDSGTKDFTLYYSTDGTNWTTLLSDTLTTVTSKGSSEIMPIESFTFTPVDARYVKFEANSYVYNRAGLTEMWIFEHTPYWGVGTDLSKDWTIDGTDKVGAKFTEENGNTGTVLANHTGTVTLNADATFEVTGDRILTQSGAISGTGKLNKIGDGTLVLSGANNYTGDTTVSAGTLAIVGSGTLESASVTIANGAELLYDNALPRSPVSQTFDIKQGGTFEIYRNTTPAHDYANSGISNVNNATVTFTGDGTWVKSGSGELWCSSADYRPIVFELSSKAKMVIEDGTFYNGGWKKTTWTNNKAELVISSAGALNLWDGNMMVVGGLTGEAGSRIICDQGNSNGISVGNGVDAKQTFTYDGTINCSKASKFYKDGAGRQVMTGAISGVAITVNSGVLELTGAAIPANGAITVISNGTLEYNVAEGDTRLVNVTTSKKIVSAGQVFKTGNGTLQINAAQNSVEMDSLALNSGRLDYKGYFTGDIDVINGVVLSPGNSVGTMYETGDLTLKSGASLLMELGGTDASENDQLIVTGNIFLEEGAFVDLVLADNSSLGPNSTFTAILSGTNSPDLADNFIDNYVRSSIFTDLQYAPLSNGLYAITGRIDPNAVPEPSTWALLILGVAGLLYWRKRK